MNDTITQRITQKTRDNLIAISEILNRLSSKDIKINIKPPMAAEMATCHYLEALEQLEFEQNPPLVRIGQGTSQVDIR